MKLEFSRHIFEKYLNIKFLCKSAQWEPSFPCGRTDRHEANSRFSQFCERAYKRKCEDCVKPNEQFVTIPRCRLRNFVS
jgi:hypothetical protein